MQGVEGLFIMTSRERAEANYQGRKHTLDSLMTKFEPVTESGCWVWNRWIDRRSGYAYVTYHGKIWKAHRLFYTLLRGSIPDGLVTDHLCRVRCCVNPNHLQIVTNKENIHRGIGLTAINKRKTHCIHGHPFNEENTYSVPSRPDRRRCKACERARYEPPPPPGASDNGVILITEDNQFYVGSRNQWILTPENIYPTDPFGFARWAQDHKDELIAGLGIGRHFGEWWGVGIQRRYGLNEKRFSLFNTSRWIDDAVRPKCCHVVPVLYEGMFNTDEIQHVMEKLAINGSQAAPGFMRPEGIVVFHKAANLCFKKTIEKDEEPKGKQ